MENLRKIDLEAVIPDEIRPYFDKIPDNTWEDTLDTMETLIRPTRQQRYVRVQFNKEFNESVQEKRQMELRNIVKDVCTVSWFTNFINEPTKMVWMMTPMVPYDTHLEEILDSSLRNLTKILEMSEIRPVWDKKTGDIMGEELDPRVVKLKLDVVKMLDMRKHGGYTQRSENKNLNANLSKNSDVEGDLSLEDIQKKIRLLETEREVNTNLIGYQKDTVVDSLVEADKVAEEFREEMKNE